MTLLPDLSTYGYTVRRWSGDGFTDWYTVALTAYPHAHGRGRPVIEAFGSGRTPDAAHEAASADLLEQLKAVR